jgi:hypothetical protein
MRSLRSRLALLGSALATVALTGVASAAVGTLQPISGFNWTPGGPVLNAPVPGSTYGVFTGVATAAGNLALLEPTAPPVRDDVVLFDGILPGEQINDYVAAAASVQRFVTESDVDNGNGTRTMTITVTGVLPTGGPGDLWPSGFNSGGTALTSGGFGIGLNLPASLGGADPLNFLATSEINSAGIAISTSGTFAAPLTLPSTFFDSTSIGYPVSGWNGVLGVSLGNGATGTAIQDGIRLTVNYTLIPEPATLSLAGLAAVGLVRRRRA